MKRALAYGTTAILLGAVMMLTPWMLVKQDSYDFLDSGGEEAVRCFSGKGEETFSGKEALERMTSLPNLSFAGLMLIPSFLIALGAFLYLKKRMF